MRAVIEKSKKNLPAGWELYSEGEAEQQGRYVDMESRGVTKTLSNRYGYWFIVISKDTTMTNVSVDGKLLEFPSNGGTQEVLTEQILDKLDGFKRSSYRVNSARGGRNANTTFTFMPHGLSEGKAYYLIFRYKGSK